MRNKKRPQSASSSSTRSSASLGSDFYGVASGEESLYSQASRPKGSARTTQRHQALIGKRKPNADQRDKKALVATMKAASFLVFILIVLIAVKWGAVAYEQRLTERVEEKKQIADQTEDPSMNVLQDPMSIASTNAPVDHVAMKNLVSSCDEAEQLLSAAKTYMLHGDVAAAIEKCLIALETNPYHVETLEMLGDLYFQNKNYSASALALSRLIKVNPREEEPQQNLLRSLSALEDAASVLEVANWYLANPNQEYNHDVQRYVAEAYYRLEDYENALIAYDRLLNEQPNNVSLLEMHASVLMNLERYEDALTTLLKVQDLELPSLFSLRATAICYAQLNQAFEAVDVLERAARRFGAAQVISWLMDSAIDPIRSDNGFKAFEKRVNGSQYQEYLAAVEARKQQEKQSPIQIDVTLPEPTKGKDNPFLNQ